MPKQLLVSVFSTLLALSTFAAADDAPWPVPVAGWVAPAGGEHPRLFFRLRDLPELKLRAQTPEGKVIVARLRVLLNGSDGQSLPAKFNDTDAKGGSVEGPDGTVLTLWHPAGYGFLYQLTGEQKYADLGRQCMEKILAGTRDRDSRYAYLSPNGALRAGPSLGAVAMGYDLCYGGWDEPFRLKVAKAMESVLVPSHWKAWSREPVSA
ncbi:MAG TPA: hypothetical protein VK968_01105 [Roseimicrobium sp.]|nr:hypothetical protein [Roseimicrobium sp.]